MKEKKIAEAERLRIPSLDMDGYEAAERICSTYETARGLIMEREDIYPPGISQKDYEELYFFSAFFWNGYLAIYGATYDENRDILSVTFHRKDDRIRREFTLRGFKEGPEVCGRILTRLCIDQYLREQHVKAGELLEQEEALRRERLSVTERTLAIRKHYEDNGIMGME